MDAFDAVAIIRGGGATSELTSFDSYLLAASCAQFPLPIITGIGHERDETVLDIVAHTRAKTPTAVAEFLISKMDEAMGELLNCQLSLVMLTRQKLQDEMVRLNTYELKSTYVLKDWVKQQSQFLDMAHKALRLGVERNKKEQLLHLDNLEKQLALISPENLLKKGYTITTLNGKMIKDSSQLKKGDKLITQFYDGVIESTID